MTAPQAVNRSLCLGLIHISTRYVRGSPDTQGPGGQVNALTRVIAA